MPTLRSGALLPHSDFPVFYFAKIIGFSLRFLLAISCRISIAVLFGIWVRFPFPHIVLFLVTVWAVYFFYVGSFPRTCVVYRVIEVSAVRV